MYFLPWNRPLNVWINTCILFRKQPAGDYQIVVSTEVLSPLLYSSVLLLLVSRKSRERACMHAQVCVQEGALPHGCAEFQIYA